MTEKYRHDKKLDFIDRRTFDEQVSGLNEVLDLTPIEPPTDGWDPAPREIDIESTLLDNNSIPLGHIALRGDFDTPDNDAG